MPVLQDETGKGGVTMGNKLLKVFLNLAATALIVIVVLLILGEVGVPW